VESAQSSTGLNILILIVGAEEDGQRQNP